MRGDPGAGGGLVAEVELGVGSDEEVGQAFGTQAPDEGAADQAVVAGDPDAGGGGEGSGHERVRELQARGRHVNPIPRKATIPRVAESSGCMAGIEVASEGDLTRAMASKRQIQNRETQSQTPKAKRRTKFTDDATRQATRRRCLTCRLRFVVFLRVLPFVFAVSPPGHPAIPAMHPFSHLVLPSSPPPL